MYIRKQERMWKGISKGRKRKKGKKEEELLKNLSYEKDIWIFINNYVKKREIVKNKIKIEDWRYLFMGLLEWKGEKIIRERAINENEKCKDIECEEIIRVVRKLKKKKAAGVHRLPNEV